MLREFLRAVAQVVSGRNFLQSLAAVLAGNAAYFLLLTPILPPVARHRVSAIDLGLVIDFWVCLVFYGVIELIFPRKRRPRRDEACR